MPSFEVAALSDPAELLGLTAVAPGVMWLDGGGGDSWHDGIALLSAAPRARLEVFAAGWARWSAAGRARWISGDPLQLWQGFMRTESEGLGAGVDRAAPVFLSVLAYELKHWIEHLHCRHLPAAVPVISCALYDWAVRFDYRARCARIDVARPEQRDAIIRLIEEARRHPLAPAPAWSSAEPVLTRDEYLGAVHRVLEYIARGDVYQVNFAQPFVARGDRRAAPALFATLRGRYPMPFGAYVDGGSWSAVSGSPECLLAVDGRRVATFPIKGTRAHAARGGLTEEPKERAEHVMIVDLERNDLGRVCEIGSVEVARFATPREFPLLAHMESEVRGQLRPDVSLADLLRATFPGGSITGAPKIRAMQIIDELEQAPRGIYTGAIGWTDLQGRSRFSLPIRTATVCGNRLCYCAGGGIVADSDPEREYEETLLKSEAFFRSLADPTAPAA